VRKESAKGTRKKGRRARDGERKSETHLELHLRQSVGKISSLVSDPSVGQLSSIDGSLSGVVLFVARR